MYDYQRDSFQYNDRLLTPTQGDGFSHVEFTGHHIPDASTTYWLFIVRDFRALSQQSLAFYLLLLFF